MPHDGYLQKVGRTNARPALYTNFLSLFAWTHWKDVALD